ncbi:MAG: hypothetical protein H6582_05610 [Crocinitomicaceae bacterium]|nr:hypothetical protein [Crocinitomicaceae bacterium]
MKRKFEFIKKEIESNRIGFISGLLIAGLYFVAPGVLNYFVQWFDNIFLSHLISGSRLDWVCYLSLFVIAAWTLRSIYTAKDVSLTVFFHLTLLYFLYLIDENYFHHWDYHENYLQHKFYGKYAHPLDFTVFPLVLGFLFIKLVNGFPHEKETDSEKGFILDKFERDKDKDLVDSEKIIVKVEEKIKETSLSESAFILGLEGAWGNGKSTHLDLLYDKFDENEWIKIRFDSWYSESAEQIVFEYFKEFRNGIRKYNRKLSRQLLFYSQDLLKFYKNNKILGPLQLSIDLFKSSPTYHKYYDSINQQISKLDRKIIILVDDLDRLDPKQIWEVLRLVKVTGSFSNTVFVLAYDKEYIGNAISQINTHESYRFIEKIVSYEHHLVPIPNNILISYLLELVSQQTQLKNEHLDQIRTLLEAKQNLIAPFIKNFRDVKRFVNSFQTSLSYAPFKELDIRDYFVIELVRYKYFPVYEMLYKRRYELFKDGSGPFTDLKTTKDD